MVEWSIRGISALSPRDNSPESDLIGANEPRDDRKSSSRSSAQHHSERLILQSDHPSGRCCFDDLAPESPKIQSARVVSSGQEISLSDENRKLRNKIRGLHVRGTAFEEKAIDTARHSQMAASYSS